MAVFKSSAALDQLGIFGKKENPAHADRLAVIRHISLHAGLSRPAPADKNQRQQRGHEKGITNRRKRRKRSRPKRARREGIVQTISHIVFVTFVSFRSMT